MSSNNQNCGSNSRNIAASSNDPLPWSLVCPNCEHSFSLNEYVPIQSQTCKHSICAVCITIEAEKRRSGNGNGNSNTSSEYMPCCECQAENAYHLTHYKQMQNLLACGALSVLHKIEKKLLGKNQPATSESVKQTAAAIANTNPKSKSKSKSKSNAFNQELADERKRNAISPSSSYDSTDDAQSNESEDQQKSKAASGNHKHQKKHNNSKKTMFSSQKHSLTSESPQITDKSSAHHDHAPPPAAAALVSPAVGERKLVFVNFGKTNHLAYLLSIHGDKARIRWESNKFEQEVDVSHLEEIETNAGSSASSNRPKRTRNSKRSRESLHSSQQKVGRRGGEGGPKTKSMRLNN